MPTKNFPARTNYFLVEFLSLFYFLGEGIVMILRGCQVEEDKDVATALQSNSLCYTAEIDTSCNTTCKSDDDIICTKILEDFTSSNYTSLESNRQSDDPDKCRSHKIESCACTSDFCNKSLVTFD